MRKITTRDVRIVLPKLEEVLAKEGALVITRRGRPIARLLPIAEPTQRPSHADLRARVRPVEGGSETLIREDRDAR